jgi:hypothetical protein
MRSVAVRLAVLSVLALGLAAQATVFVQRASACQSILETKAERPKCCNRGASVLLQKEGGDCCQSVDVDPADPAAISSGPEVALAYVTISASPVLRLPAPQAAHEPWRAALERGPPYPPATKNIVLLN